LPRGWIGTTSQWRQDLGIAFALLNLVLLAFAWRSLRAGTSRARPTDGSSRRSAWSPWWSLFCLGSSLGADRL